MVMAVRMLTFSGAVEFHGELLVAEQPRDTTAGAGSKSNRTEPKLKTAESVKLEACVF